MADSLLLQTNASNEKQAMKLWLATNHPWIWIFQEYGWKIYHSFKQLFCWPYNINSGWHDLIIITITLTIPSAIFWQFFLHATTGIPYLGHSDLHAETKTKYDHASSLISRHRDGTKFLSFDVAGMIQGIPDVISINMVPIRQILVSSLH